jgi:hypothetical protein
MSSGERTRHRSCAMFFSFLPDGEHHVLMHNEEEAVFGW